MDLIINGYIICVNQFYRHQILVDFFFLVLITLTCFDVHYYDVDVSYQNVNTGSACYRLIALPGAKFLPKFYQSHLLINTQNSKKKIFSFFTLNL